MDKKATVTELVLCYKVLYKARRGQRETEAQCLIHWAWEERFPSLIHNTRSLSPFLIRQIVFLTEETIVAKEGFSWKQAACFLI